MTHPQRRPAATPELPKAPSTGHPARELREIEAPPAVKAPREQLVNFGGRIPESLRRRARFYSVEHEVDLQDVITEALTEYLAKREASQRGE